MLSAQKFLDKAESWLEEADLPNYFSTLGPETHIILPLDFPEVLLGACCKQFSLGHDLRCLPPKRQYVVLDTTGGDMVSFLRSRYPNREIIDLMAEVVVRRVERIQDPANFVALPPSKLGARPIMVLFTARSGGNILSRLLNACGIMPVPLAYRSPLMLSSATGVPIATILQSAAQARLCNQIDVPLSVNAQFLHIDHELSPAYNLLTWILKSDALVVSIRRSMYEQSASLSAALSTDIWEYWGEAPVINQDYDLQLEECWKTLNEQMSIFELFEDFLPSRNLLRVQYETLLKNPQQVIKNVAVQTGRPASTISQQVLKRLPSRIRSGLKIGQAGLQRMHAN